MCRAYMQPIWCLPDHDHIFGTCIIWLVLQLVKDSLYILHFTNHVRWKNRSYTSHIIQMPNMWSWSGKHHMGCIYARHMGGIWHCYVVMIWQAPYGLHIWLPYASHMGNTYTWIPYGRHMTLLLGMLLPCKVMRVKVVTERCIISRCCQQNSMIETKTILLSAVTVNVRSVHHSL